MADIGLTRRRNHGGGDPAIVALLALILLACGLWPLGRLFLEAFDLDEAGRPLGLIRDVWDSRGFLHAAGNTVTASSLSVLVSAVLGGGLALVAVMALVLVPLAGAALITRVMIARRFTVAVPHGVPFRGSIRRGGDRQSKRRSGHCSRS